MAELRALSTRATITPTRLQNVYHWGDFKGDPSTWMEKYFDAFVYVANWTCTSSCSACPVACSKPRRRGLTRSMASLKDLHDISARRDGADAFAARLRPLRIRYAKRVSLLDLLDRAGLRT
jgi:hypothetical protein